MSMPLKVLNRAFVLFCGNARTEGPEIAPLLCLRICFAGIKSVLTALQFADHTVSSRVQDSSLR
jgi:hypothetical protein